MRNLSVHERLEAISRLISQRKDLASPLRLHMKILQIQREIDDTPTKGTKMDCGNQALIASMQRNSREKKEPIVHFIDPAIFDYGILASVAKKVTEALIEKDPNNEGLKRFAVILESGKADLVEFVKATLKEDATAIGKYAEESGVQPQLFLHIISVLSQPCLEEIARRVDASFIDGWWQISCPVCGRTPNVARVKDGKRYLVCTFCGAEHLADRFVCVSCGNSDPYTLKYLIVEGKPEFHIDFCTRCKHYVKVIDEAELGEPIPRGLEDLLTLDLDLVAKKAGLVRD